MIINNIKKLFCILMVMAVIFSFSSCKSDVSNDIEVVHEENDDGYVEVEGEDGSSNAILASNISTAGRFKNGHAWIEYSSGTKKEALIDKTGRIIYSVDVGHGIGTILIGKSSASYYSYDKKGSYIIDFNGNNLTSSETGDFDVIFANKDDGYLVYKYQKGIDGSKQFLGIIDANGNFTVPLIECKIMDGSVLWKKDLSVPATKYLGAGLFKINLWSNIYYSEELFFNSETGKYFIIKFNSGSSNIISEVVNGKVYANCSGTIIKEDGTETNIDGCFAFTPDGNFERVPDFGGIRNNMLIKNDSDIPRLTITDPITGKTSYFSKYKVSSIAESNECIAVNCIGADSNTYVTVLDENGEMKFEPVLTTGRGCAVGDGLLVYMDPDSKNITVMDCEGNVLLSDIECEGMGPFSEGLSSVSFRNASGKEYHRYMDKNGNFVIG